MGTSKFAKLAVVILCLMSVTPAMAQGRGRGSSRGGVQIGAGGGQQNQQAMQQQIQQIGQQLQQGQQVLTDASEKATEVRQVWQKADADHKQNLRELAQAKKSAEEDAKNSPELKAAKDKLETLRGELADVRKKVIETLLKDNEEYQKASKVYEAAVAEQKANMGAGVSPETRRELTKKVADADKSKRTIEDVAMANDSDAKELTKQIKEATAELGMASKRKTESIESDPKLSSAKVAFLRTRDELKKAKSDLDQADGEANRIRSAMQALVNQRNAIQNQINLQQRMQQGGNNGNQQNGNRNGRSG
ncbi:MAG: actin B [Planctomycetota bacterium]|nr:MAG: actin B [Planctomycetota bacterium]